MNFGTDPSKGNPPTPEQAARILSLLGGLSTIPAHSHAAYSYNLWVAGNITTPAGGPFPVVASDGSPYTWLIKSWDDMWVLGSTEDTTAYPDTISDWELTGGVEVDGVVSVYSAPPRDGLFIGEIRNDFGTDLWYTWNGTVWVPFVPPLVLASNNDLSITLSASFFGKKTLLTAAYSSAIELIVPSGIGGQAGDLMFFRRAAGADPVVFNAPLVTINGSAGITDVGEDGEFALMWIAPDTYDFI